MKSGNFYIYTRRILLPALFFLLFFPGISFQLKGNPIEIPPCILEIYFEPGSDGWLIEMMISEYIGGENLDGMRIKGLYSDAQFNPGIAYTPEVPFIITPEDFQTPLYINREGDCIVLEFFTGSYWVPFDYFGLPFGEFEPGFWESSVTAPVDGQSIAWQKFVYPENYDYFWTVKELPNTIGFSPFQVSEKATFSGYVIDKDDEPLQGIKLKYCNEVYHYYTIPTLPELFTNEEGYFYTDAMFCKIYTIQFLHEGGILGDTVISIEPDSANYFIFNLDTLLTGIHEIKPEITAYSIYTSPNPSTYQTTIIIESDNSKPNRKGVIKIYSEAGFIVDIIPVEISQLKEELRYDFREKSLTNGLYFCNLEINNHKVASVKMIINR